MQKISPRGISEDFEYVILQSTSQARHLTVPLKCNVRHARQHVARFMLELDVYHLESARLQLKTRSTLGLQRNCY